MKVLIHLISILLFSLESFAQVPSLKLESALPGNLFIELARAINPTVVNISTSTRARRNRGQDPMLEMLERFYGPGFQMPEAQPQQALGTGFVIREDGLILTNNHVIDGADEIRVSFTETDDKGLLAEVIGKDARTDIALLKIKGTNRKFPYAVLGSSKDVQVGEWVAAFGNPYGHGHTVTKGIISAKGREIGELNRLPFLQTDASINPGNSGGPLVNTKGFVIGVNSAIDARAQGIGFAIPIDDVKTIIADLEKNGKVKIGYLGVSLATLNPRISKQLGISATEGVVVTQVMAGSPAENAGLQTYDVIIEFAGKKIKQDVDLTNVVAGSPIGTKSKMKILRDNRELNLDVVVKERPDERKMLSRGKLSPKKNDSTLYSLGFVLANIDGKHIREFGIDESLTGMPIVVEVQAGTPAAMAGLNVGDVIFDVNRKRVRNANEANKQLKPGANTLRIQRGNVMGFIVIEGQ